MTIVPTFRPDGTVMDLVNPLPSDIVWSEVANALSKIACFNGRYACPAYSVAQHCVMGADALFNETGDQVLAGYFLLHDAHEAPFGDITRPALASLQHYLALILRAQGMKRVPGRLLSQAAEMAKSAIDAAIFEAAGLPVLPNMPNYQRHVRDMDERMMRAEAIALFGSEAARHVGAEHLPAPRLTGAIKPWGPMKAEELWLDRLHRYLGIEARSH